MQTEDVFWTVIFARAPAYALLRSGKIEGWHSYLLNSHFRISRERTFSQRNNPRGAFFAFVSAFSRLWHALDADPRERNCDWFHANWIRIQSTPKDLQFQRVCCDVSTIAEFQQGWNAGLDGFLKYVVQILYFQQLAMYIAHISATKTVSSWPMGFSGQDGRRSGDLPFEDRFRWRRAKRDLAWLHPENRKTKGRFVTRFLRKPNLYPVLTWGRRFLLHSASMTCSRISFLV